MNYFILSIKHHTGNKKHTRVTISPQILIVTGEFSKKWPFYLLPEDYGGQIIKRNAMLIRGYKKQIELAANQILVFWKIDTFW